MTEVLGTEEFADWFQGLSEADALAVVRAVDTLEIMGVALGHPLSSAIQGSKYALRELRIQSRGHPLRVIYAFDPARQAVLLIGGDKTGDNRFYEVYIPRAERLWEEYVAENRPQRNDRQKR
jgi:hypothetical protein